MNLLPRIEVERRERIAVIRRWGWGLVASLALLAALIAGAFALQVSASLRLVSEQARNTELLAELAGLSEVSRTLALRSELEGLRADAMAADLRWEPLWSRVASALPSGVVVVGFDAVPGGIPQGEDPVIEHGLVARITVAAPGPVELAPSVRSLRDYADVISVEGRELTRADGDGAAYTYALDVSFDQTIYTRDYAEEEAE